MSQGTPYIAMEAGLHQGKKRGKFKAILNENWRLELITWEACSRI